MRYEVQELVIDYSKVNFGSIIVMYDTLWAVLLAEDDADTDKECLLVSLATNQVLSSFEDLGDVAVYLKLYEDSIVKILTENEFKLKVVEV